MADPDVLLGPLYVQRLRLLVRKSPLSHGHIAVVLADMLESDMVILWQLMGNAVQSGPFEQLLGAFMADVQARVEADPQLRQAVHDAIVEQLLRVEGHLHLQ